MLINLLTGCFAVATLLEVVPAPILAQSATPAIDADRAVIENLVRRYYAIAASDDLSALGDVLAPDFVITNAPPGEDAGLDGLVFSLKRARVSRPDFTFRIEDVIIAGNAVVVRTTIGGTHLGDFFGVRATGTWIEIPAIDLWHVENGKLADVSHHEDILGMMEQLGMIPGVEVPTATPTTGPTTPAPASATVDASQIAANTALARRFREELLAQGDRNAAAAILAQEVIWHFDAPPGVAGVEAATLDLRSAFPDLTVTVDEIVAEGDRVAIVWTVRGTHRGEFLGIEATGNPVSMSGMDIFRITDGRIAEIWTVGDELGLLFQLEAFP
jgi:steroid delta-isomerase-like uncharacterized protein